MNRFTPDNIKNNLEGISSYGHEVCVNLLTSFEDYNIKNKNSSSYWFRNTLDRGHIT